MEPGNIAKQKLLGKQRWLPSTYRSSCRRCEI